MVRDTAVGYYAGTIFEKCVFRHKKIMNLTGVRRRRKHASPNFLKASPLLPIKSFTSCNTLKSSCSTRLTTKTTTTIPSSALTRYCPQPVRRGVLRTYHGILQE
ncbi:unnamed protein product [Ectocarpus sp. 12 AP-2014]